VSRPVKFTAPAPRHVRSSFDLTPEETRGVVDLALRLKRDRAAGVDQRYLPGKVLGLVFEKPSLRTRVSFEAAIAHLGGACIFLTGKEVGLGERETVADFAGVMSGYVDALAIRTFAQSRVDELAAASAKPVINALSDRDHPCQALGDLATVLEHFGRLDGIRIAFVGTRTTCRNHWRRRRGIAASNSRWRRRRRTNSTTSSWRGSRRRAGPARSA